MKMKTWSLIGAAAAAGALLLAWAFAPRPVEVEVADVSSGPFEVTIDEEGKTRLTERYVVSAPLAGRLARITLREGDAVSVDTVVATLTPVLSPLLDERTTRELNARIEAAQAGLQISGRLCRTAKIRQELIRKLSALGPVRRVEGLARVAKEAAQGAAIIADGLAG